MISIALDSRPERRSTFRALAPIGSKYPSGLEWLEGRLDAIAAGKAQMAVALWDGRPAAWSILTPKGAHRLKLSTFLVAPQMRRQGIGASLLVALQSSWRSQGIEQVHVTIDEGDPSTRSFFEAYGFLQLPDAWVSYGDGRRDSVYVWTPETT
jgi:GNAT superfamily N-acetyltransferase